MRLMGCHIENFGKLSDLDIEFDTGISVIYEENGWGKSTLAAFIKVMFFGFANEGKQDELANERKRFLPWQKGVYGGRIVFEAGGKEYRLERTFDSRRTGTDTCELYDHETNRRYDITDEMIRDGNIGEALFGIDRGSFQRSVFIGQQDCAFTGATAEISAKIGNVSDQTADMGNYETVMARLEKELNHLSPRRKTGRISRLKSEAADLETRVREREALEKKRNHTEKEIRQLQESREEYQENQRKIRERIRQFDEDRELQIQAEIYTSLQNAERTAEEMAAYRQESFSGRVPSVREIDEQLERIRECRNIRSSLSSRREQAEMLEEMAQSARNEEEGAEHSVRKIFLILGAVLLAAGLIMFLAGFLFPGILTAGFGMGAAGLWFYLSRLDEGASEDSSVQVDVYKAAENKAKKLKQEMEADERRASETEWEIRDYLDHFWRVDGLVRNDNVEEGLRILRRTVMEVQSAEQEYQIKKKDRENFEADHDMMALERFFSRYENQTRPGSSSLEDSDEERNDYLSEGFLKDMTEQMDQIQSETDELASRIYELENQAEMMVRQLEKLEREEAELQETKRQIDHLMHRYEVIRRTKHYLELAKTGFSAKYMGTVRSSFDRYYQMISGGKVQKYQMDADFNVRIREHGSLHDTGLMSEGTQDLIGLCRRMAMVEAMYEKEKPFLIFDDPFVNLDDYRLEKALEFLDLIADEYQVIYFSCSEARLPSGLS